MPGETKLSLRFPTDLVQQVDALATSGERSRTRQLVWLTRRGLESLGSALERDRLERQLSEPPALAPDRFPGWRRMHTGEVWIGDGGALMITGRPNEAWGADDSAEFHDCDAMGCPSTGAHVLWLIEDGEE